MIKEALENLRASLPEGVNLVAVSKFHPAEAAMEAYNAGQRRFGESRVQEFLDKRERLPQDIEWHFIGHLQTNKVKHIIGKTALIESVDTEKLLELIDSESRKKNLITRVLMQIHVAAEETKFGFSPQELHEYFMERRFERLTNTHICGVMGMATNTDDKDRVRADFHLIYDVYESIRSHRELGLRGFDIVSMGMSGDWKIAVEEGSNMIRVGSLIFGPRNY